MRSNVGHFHFSFGHHLRSQKFPELIMSSATYSTYWKESNDLHKTLQSYEKPSDSNLQVRDRSSAFQLYAVLYVKYISLYRKLEIAYDQLLHPQKRILLKYMLVAAIGRLLEVKQILVEMECSDFFNLSEVLLDLKLTHDALEVPVPKFIAEENENSQIKKMLHIFNAKEFQTGKPNIFIPRFSLEEAVMIIQTNERGRQGKLRAKYINDLQAEAQQDKMLLLTNPEDRERAAGLITRIYRGYCARKRVAVMRYEQMIFLGMASSSVVSLPNEEHQRRKRIQKLYESDYSESLASTKEKILKSEGPDIKEAIQDDFRQWYMEQKRVTGKFPDFPSENEWRAPDFKFNMVPSIAEDSKLLAKGAKGSSKPTTPKSVSSKPTTPKGKGKKDDENDSSTKFKSLGSSEFIKMGTEQVQKFDAEWRGKDESDNFAQRHDQNIVKNAKRKEVEAQIKEEVYVILEEELQNLKLAVEKDGKKKGKIGKAKKPKKEKKDGKKGKKDKDLTADRTIESLVEELIQTGIMQKYSPCYFKSWLGNTAIMIGNYNLTEPLMTKDTFIAPSVAEVPRVFLSLIKVLVECCALPLGVPFAGDDSIIPKFPKISSILLYGASGTGKSKLVQSLATELGATLFNLSPKNTEGQYQGKQNVTKMIHMVFKIAKANSPAIVYVEGIEMIFAKKVELMFDC